MSAIPSEWSALTAWVRAPQSAPSAVVQELLGGLVPETPDDRHELLVLALLAVCADSDRLAAELAARRHLTSTGIPVEVLVDYQRDLVQHLLGTTGPLAPLEAAITDHAPPEWRSLLHAEVLPDVTWHPRSLARIAEAWDAAVLMGHLAQTIACALGLRTVTFYRSLLGVDSTSRIRPNSAACVAQPWATGRDQRATLMSGGHGLVRVTAHPASLVTVAHPDLHRALSAHPSTFIGETGHPAVTAYPALAIAAPHALVHSALVFSRWVNITPPSTSGHAPAPPLRE